MASIGAPCARSSTKAASADPRAGRRRSPCRSLKNLFLWPGRSYIRKALEIPLALVLDFAWPKRRILEIYLNIAEWGDDGLFGAEAAANFYFHEPAAALTLHQAALLAAVLPDPYHRKVLKPNRHVTVHARIVEARVRAGGTNLPASGDETCLNYMGVLEYMRDFRDRRRSRASDFGDSQNARLRV